MHREFRLLLTAVLLWSSSLAAQDSDQDWDWGTPLFDEPSSTQPASQSESESDSQQQSPAQQQDAQAPSESPRSEQEAALDWVPVEPLAPESEPEPAPQEKPNRGGRGMLEEIVVTAQKKAESLQDAPISLAAFNADQLQTSGISGLADLSGNVPSLAIEPFPTSNATLRFYIRGIGVIDAQITQDPAIGVYIDGVYIARSSGNALDIADLERIEVLRGPQGTLYGRNTTGGAINLITRRPSVDGVSFSQKLAIGNRNYIESKSSLNLPLGDSFAAKLALLGNNRDGFVENTGEGRDFGDRQSLGTRLDLRWLASDALTLDYGYEFSETEYVNYLYQAVLTPESNKGQADIIKRFGQANTVYSDRRLGALATGAPMEPSITRVKGHALTVTRDFIDFELKYIGAYRELSDAAYADLGGGAGSTEYRLDTNVYDGPAATLANGGPTPLDTPTTTQSQWSHELQLSGSLFDSSLEYIVGGFYFTEKAREDRRVLQHQFSSGISPDQTFAVVGPLMELGLIPIGATLPRLVNLLALDNNIRNEALAVFGQATWTPDILDQRLHLTFGYRHSEDRREAVKFRISDNYLEYNINGQGVAVPLSSSEMFDDVQASRTFTDNSVSLISKYDVNDDINVYAKYVEAYKSGGFNTRDPQVSGESGPASDGNDYGYGYKEGFAPERVISYEAGIKTELFDRRLRLNTNLFLSDYTDMQINFLLAGTITDTKTENAGRAKLQGFEVDGTWLAAEDLLLTASYAYIDARITEVIDVDGNDVADQFQFSSAPRHSASVSGDWTLWRAGFGNVQAHLAYNYVGERLGGAKAGQPVRLEGYRVLNGRIGVHALRLGGGDLSISVWAKNLLDEEYAISAIDNLPQADRAVIWGESRTFGLDTVFRFGR